MDDGWLRDFNDPVLDKLIDEALANNPGLSIRRARGEEAEAMAAMAGSKLKPALGFARGYADRNSASLDEIYGASLKISWEADVWGRIRSGTRAAEEQAAATRSGFLFARQSLAAQTAGAGFWP